jgi:hypothetical protein
VGRLRDFLAQNWGNLASVAGLLVAGLSAVFAKRASVAAREAKAAVLTRTMAEDVNNAHKLAAEVANLVELQKYERALIRCNDLIDSVTLIVRRWESVFSLDSKNNYLEVKSLIDSVHKVLSRSSAETSAIAPRAFLRLNETCRTIRTILVEEHAAALLRISGDKDAG